MNRIVRTLPVVVLLAAVLCNEWVFSVLLYNGQQLDGATRVKIWIASIALLSLAVLLHALHKRRVARFFVRDYPSLGALSLGLLFAFVLVLLVEFIFLGLNSMRAKPDLELTTSFVKKTAPHPALGSVPEPGRSHVSTLRCDGVVEYDVSYSIDSFGRRLAPANARADEMEPPPFYLMCFGGSFMFGEGVDDEDALPNQLALRAPQYEIYNFGFGGHGPNQMLARVLTSDFKAQIRQERGIVLYLFIPPHIRRARGSMRLLTTWGRHTPSFDTEGPQVRPLGLFPDAQPWRVAWYDLLSHEQILRYMEADWPLATSRADLVHTTRIVRAAQDRIWSEWGSVNFYVVIYPAKEGYAESYQVYSDAFEEAGLAVLNYADLFDRGDPELMYRCDPHPRPEAYRRLADALANDLDLATGEPKY